ncbi:hypothetical protein PsorP6_001758 [Peronosclerospora sorghi]|uniref:Uncharacterized protein n=1 Tax=Peronosclerospora sorghi TaxID=230839 RepID=A0ACC0WQA3_9STRA|nr:hypothetical protein PsorP6_001758 [Peronosclerospora sorghi]
MTKPDKRNGFPGNDIDVFDFAPLAKLRRERGFLVPQATAVVLTARSVQAPDVQRARVARKVAHAVHIVTIRGMPRPTETVVHHPHAHFVRERGQAMVIVALGAPGTHAAGKVETECAIRFRDAIGFGRARVARKDTARGGRVLAPRVVPVVAHVLVVPDIILVRTFEVRVGGWHGLELLARGARARERVEFRDARGVVVPGLAAAKPARGMGRRAHFAWPGPLRRVRLEMVVVELLRHGIEGFAPSVLVPHAVHDVRVGTLDFGRATPETPRAARSAQRQFFSYTAYAAPTSPSVATAVTCSVVMEKMVWRTQVEDEAWENRYPDETDHTTRAWRRFRD